MAVLSKQAGYPSRRIVSGLGLADFFFQVYGGNSFPTRKPDPLGRINCWRRPEWRGSRQS